MLNERRQARISDGFSADPPIGEGSARRAGRGFDAHRPDHGDLHALEGGAIDGGAMNSLIREEVIPRLLAFHRTGVAMATEVPTPDVAIDADDVARMALDSEASHLVEVMGALGAAGLDPQHLLLDLLAPAAHILGRQWESDDIDFVAVTMGLWRLQQAVHAVAAHDHRPRMPARRGGRRPVVLCATMPGDDHHFGSLVLEQIFAQAGWQTLGGRGDTAAELVERAGRHRVDLVTLTCSIDHPIGAVRSLVGRLRARPSEPAMRVMVGGGMFLNRPELAAASGADGSAADAPAAVAMAARLVGIEEDGADHLDGGRLGLLFRRDAGLASPG